MDNLITLPRWEKYCKNLCKSNDNYILFDILNLNEANLDKFNFKQYANKTIILLNPDCDFPPPKSLYLNDNNLNMIYEDRIYYNVIEYIEKYNINVVCYSSSVSHPMINMIPLGVSWQYTIPNLNVSNKSILCYANFGLPTVDCWHGRIRNNLNNIIKQINYITLENVSLDTQERKNINKYKTFFNNLSMSKFAICPRGCGIDCYRMYDALYYECIPIILKSEDFYKNVSKFPVLVLDKWEDLFKITQYELVDKYSELMKIYSGYKNYLDIEMYKV
tara:strand:+ start:4639 stop:5466 length:828 start_codon:yes stop_codon:yes gene_type:complete